RQRQFVSDASHELRSPVTTIRAQLEVALNYAERADWPDVARRALAEEARLEALVTDLLLLASTDEQRDLGGRAAVDVDALVVERHHGTITVDDAPMGGARFLVTLPALAQNEPSPTSAAFAHDVRQT